MDFTVRGVSADVWHRLRSEAHRRGLSVPEAVRQAFEAWLESDMRAEPAEATAAA